MLGYKRIRSSDIRHQVVAANPGAINNAIAYHDRTAPDGTTAIDILRALAKKRFARYLKRDSTNTIDGTITKGLEYITSEETALQIDEGITETVLLGIDSAIARATATLFTQPSQRWEYYQGDSEENDEDIAELINKYRTLGHAYTSMQRWDTMSCVARSAVLALSWRSGDECLQYQIWRPSDVYIGYGSDITIDGTDKTRVASWDDIEDASIVVLRLGKENRQDKGDHDGRFLAYMGRSQALPQGRCVMYNAQNPFDVPEFLDNSVLNEYQVGDEPCNPLTKAMDEYGPDAIPHEYPISILYGNTGNYGLLPTDATTYEVSREFDLAASRILSAASDGARGTVVFELDAAGGEGRMPRSIRGVCSVPRGLKRSEDGFAAASASQKAWALLCEQISMFGETLANVGGFEVTPDAGRAPESGFALSIRVHPKRQYREQRIDINKGSVARLFALERSLLMFHSDEKVPEDVKQVWYPGELTTPRNPREELEILVAKREAGAISNLEFLRRANNLETIDQAMELATRIKEHNEMGAKDGAQRTILNGAQLTAMVEVSTRVALGEVAPETGKALLMLAIPDLTEEEAARAAGQKLEQPQQPAAKGGGLGARLAARLGQ